MEENNRTDLPRPLTNETLVKVTGMYKDWLFLPIKHVDPQQPMLFKGSQCPGGVQQLWEICMEKIPLLVPVIRHGAGF